MVTMIKQFQRQHVVSQLVKFNVTEIDGQPLDKVKYSILLKTLALKRAADN